MDDFDKFIKDQVAKNTTYNTKSAYNLLKRYFKSIDEPREIINIPQEDLNKLLCGFFLNIRKLNGSNYETDSLSKIHQALHRIQSLKLHRCLH